MSRENEFGRYEDDIQRYLDGDAVAGLNEQARADAERFEEAIAAYAASLDLPGRDVDRAVMAAIGARHPGVRRPLWRWLFQPQALQVRPALAAAVALLAFGLTWAVARRGPPFSTSLQRPVPALAAAHTVLVRFELLAPAAQRVSVSGSFSGWDERGIPLTRNPETGLWTVTVPLPPGEYQYLFLVDGDGWTPDPSAHAQVDDGFGQTNSVIVVGPRGVVRS